MITVTAVLQHLWSLQLSCYLSGGDKPSHKVHCPPKWGLSWLIKTSTFLSDYSPTIKDNAHGDSYFDSAPCFSFIDGLLRGANCTAQKSKNGLRRHNSLHVKSKVEQNMRKSLHVLKNSLFWVFSKENIFSILVGEAFLCFYKRSLPGFNQVKYWQFSVRFILHPEPSVGQSIGWKVNPWRLRSRTERYFDDLRRCQI